MLLKGKTALITGSNRGIGNAVLRAFAAEGADLFAHARKPSEAFSAEIEKLAAETGSNIVPVYFDLSDSSAMKAAVLGIMKSKRRIDVLVNCAGVPHGGLFSMTPVSSVKAVFETNLFAQMELTQLVLKIMSRSGGGSIINFASVMGLDCYEGQSAYGVSKAAVVKWTQTLAAEIGGTGIRVNAIAPGLTDTDMGALMDEKTREKMLSFSAAHRLAKPDEVAKVAVMLASDYCSFVNGNVIRTDGGLKL